LRPGLLEGRAARLAVGLVFVCRRSISLLCFDSECHKWVTQAALGFNPTSVVGRAETRENPPSGCLAEVSEQAPPDPIRAFLDQEMTGIGHGLEEEVVGVGA
jgi:hypothetical protein